MSEQLNPEHIEWLKHAETLNLKEGSIIVFRLPYDVLGDRETLDGIRKFIHAHAKHMDIKVSVMFFPTDVEIGILSPEEGEQ